MQITQRQRRKIFESRSCPRPTFVGVVSAVVDGVVELSERDALGVHTRVLGVIVTAEHRRTACQSNSHAIIERCVPSKIGKANQ